MTARTCLLMAVVVVAVLAAGRTNAEETKVGIKGLHLCCASCQKAVTGGAAKVEGATVTIDPKDKTVTLTAKDAETAQKAIDAIAANGEQGVTDSATIKFKDDSGAPDGKVEKLTVSGAHLCCGSCVKALQAAIGKVEGVKANTVKSGKEPFEVTGDFDAHALVKAINAAGFHVKVSK